MTKLKTLKDFVGVKVRRGKKVYIFKTLVAKWKLRQEVIKLIKDNIKRKPLNWIFINIAFGDFFNITSEDLK